MQTTNDPAGFTSARPNDPARPKDLGPDYGSGHFGSATAPAGEQAMSAGREAVGRARDAASATADALKTQAAALASEGRESVMEKAQDQKRAGAEYLSGLADKIRNAARELDSDLPFAANYVRSAASGVDQVADTVRNGNFSDLVTQTQAFARRQPTLFVGLSMLAGFGVARLLKGAAGPVMAGLEKSGQANAPFTATRASGADLRDTGDAGTAGRGAVGGAPRQVYGDKGSGI